MSKKKILFVLLLMVAQLVPATAQTSTPATGPGLSPVTAESFFGAGLGFSYIKNADGNAVPYLSLSVMPELALGKVGIGINATLRIDARDFSVRAEDWDSIDDFLAVIRYVRYGHKRNEGLYARFGALDRAQLGYGQQMYLYNNGFSLDAPKRGLAVDYDFGSFGFESIWSNLAASEVFGARLFVRPLASRKIPIIRNLTIGASVSGDLSGEGLGFVAGGNTFEPSSAIEKDGNLVIVGVDLGLPIVQTSVIDVTPFVDFAKILNYGAGVSVGIMSQARLGGLVVIDMKLEQRFMGEQYLPNYFNAFYEIEREESIPESVNNIQTKRNLLKNANVKDGWAGLLSANIIGIVNVTGSYQRLNDDPQGGWMHIEAGLAPENKSLPVVLRAAYDRWGIEGESDLFRIQDENALLSAEAGYKPYPFLLVSMVYMQSFTPAPDGGAGYIKQERFEPRVQLLFTF